LKARQPFSFCYYCVIKDCDVATIELPFGSRLGEKEEMAGISKLGALNTGKIKIP
jgi:hypothetical protein